MNPDQKLIIEKIPTDGSPVGNTRLMRELGWQSDRYWKARDALLAEESIVLGMGRGGSVRLAKPAETKEVVPVAAPAAAQPAQHESDLYEPAAKVLNSEWAKDFHLEEFFVQITAKQGRRETGGTWTRPDIILVTVTTYQFLPGKFVDVVTFEVKDKDNFNVTAVYEALAHRRAGTRAYVLAHLPDDVRKTLDVAIEDISEEAKRHGVGLIVAGQIDRYDTWAFLVQAERKEPDPAELDEFIDRQVSEENKKKLRKWLK
jgi:hypothetical protein